ncbi:PaaX family transcriptional regulator C-terminal domain-containing protein [Alkalicoccobacillus porphyridii]|uniref:Transcriptional repressor PaaX-like central Cas2-like domain-containing protein n=1 Tax=Alkalicoccobacillus porphyridii TaxID=2597270 RepID=A0A553ZWS6_9BACI|nr:PaaX family transcriptional regulator C-terminal domain-containing protein [Alkalicoccobacillus porphyridii]TSB45918.1 hypothetical protein FN960_13460 [Alkalicoccobacillus porphyridii]
MGFGHLYNNVYVYPWNISDRIIDEIDTLEIEEYITIIQSEEFLFNKISYEGFSGANAARRVWDLDNISLMYKDKSKVVDKSKHDIIKLINTSNVDYQLLLSHYLRLTIVKEELINNDPMLPPDFLPGNWIGGDVLDSIEHQLNKLTSLFKTI